MNDDECKTEPVIPTEEERLDQLKRIRNFHKVRCCANCAFRDEEETELGGIGHTYCGKEYNDSNVPAGEKWTYDVDELECVCDCHRYKEEFEKEERTENRLIGIEVRIESEISRFDKCRDAMADQIQRELEYVLSGEDKPK